MTKQQLKIRLIKISKGAWITPHLEAIWDELGGSDRKRCRYCKRKLMPSKHKHNYKLMIMPQSKQWKPKPPDEKYFQRTKQLAEEMVKREEWVAEALDVGFTGKQAEFLLEVCFDLPSKNLKPSKGS